MAAGGVESETPHGAGQGVEEAAHIGGLDGDKDADRGGQRQHARRPRTR
jgi:hypothetical protein